MDENEMFYGEELEQDLAQEPVRVLTDKEKKENKRRAREKYPTRKLWVRVLCVVLCIAVVASTTLSIASSARITGELTTSITEQAAYECLTYGLAYLQMSKYEQALEYLQAALQLTPKSPEAYAMRATVYIATTEYDKALADLLCAIEYYGEDVPTDVLLQTASIYVLQGDSQSAIPLLNWATQLDPTQTNGWLLLGQIYYENQSYALAVDCLDLYLAEYPDDVTSRAVRAACRSAIGDEEGAMEDLIIAADKGDEYPEIRTALAQVYLNLGDYAAAAGVYEMIVAADGTDTDSRQALAACYLYTGDYAGAVAQFETVYTLLSADEQASDIGYGVQFSIAVIRAALGEVEEAVIIYEELLALGYQTASVQAQLADAYAQIDGRETEAFALWDALLASDDLIASDYGLVSLSASETALWLGMYDEAIAYANVCLASEAPDESARLYRAVAYLELGEELLAQDDLDILVENNPDIANVRYYRALARLRLDNLDGALEDLYICMADPDEADIALAARDLVDTLKAADLA